MKPIRTEDEFYCQRCGGDADTVIEFENSKMVLCKKHEEEFKEWVREEHL